MITELLPNFPSNCSGSYRVLKDIINLNKHIRELCDFFFFFFALINLKITPKNLL